MILSVEGEKIQSLSSIFSILVPFSLAGLVYSVYALFSPWDHELNSMDLLPLAPLITIFAVMIRVFAARFLSMRFSISFPEGCDEAWMVRKLKARKIICFIIVFF